MGAWDHNNFENDDASEFMFDVLSDGLKAVSEALSVVLETSVDDYLEAPEGHVALAAIEIVATINGNPPEEVPNDITVWIKNNPDAKIDESLTIQAQNAFNRILNDNSELNELWEESDDYDLWLESINDLKDRIE